MLHWLAYNKPLGVFHWFTKWVSWDVISRDHPGLLWCHLWRQHHWLSDSVTRHQRNTADKLSFVSFPASVIYQCNWQAEVKLMAYEYKDSTGCSVSFIVAPEWPPEGLDDVVLTWNVTVGTDMSSSANDEAFVVASQGSLQFGHTQKAAFLKMLYTPLLKL